MLYSGSALLPPTDLAKKKPATTKPRPRPATTSEGWCRLSVMREAPMTHGAPTRTRAQSRATKRRKSPLRSKKVALLPLVAATGEEEV